MGDTIQQRARGEGAIVGMHLSREMEGRGRHDANLQRDARDMAP
jgi:hypothetical protein